MLVILNADQRMSPVIGLIENEFNVTDSHIGLIGGVFSIVSTCEPYLGIFDRRLQQEVATHCIYPCWRDSMFTLCYCHIVRSTFLLACSNWIGIGKLHSQFHTLWPAICLVTKNVAKLFLYSTKATTVGGIVGMLVAGYTAGFFGWRIPFILVSAPNLILKH